MGFFAAGKITLEVNRFDPGRPNKERTGITPTSLIAGDIAVRTQVTRPGCVLNRIVKNFFGATDCGRVSS